MIPFVIEKHDHIQNLRREMVQEEEQKEEEEAQKEEEEEEIVGVEEEAKSSTTHDALEFSERLKDTFRQIMHYKHSNTVWFQASVKLDNTDSCGLRLHPDTAFIN